MHVCFCPHQNRVMSGPCAPSLQHYRSNPGFICATSVQLFTKFTEHIGVLNLVSDATASALEELSTWSRWVTRDDGLNVREP
jgi:hypothetical protein